MQKFSAKKNISIQIQYDIAAGSIGSRLQYCVSGIQKR